MTGLNEFKINKIELEHRHIDNFQKVEAVYNKEINTWLSKKSELETKLATLRDEYTELEILQYDPLEKSDLKSLNRCRVDIENTSRQLSEIESRIEVIEKRKVERLKNIYQLVRQEVSQNRQANYDNMEKELKKLKRLRAETLLRLTEIHNLRKPALEQYTVLSNIATRYGFEEDLYRNGIRFTIPKIETSTYSGSDKPVIIQESEAHIAYNTGKVDPWVFYYRRTGEIVSNEQAIQLLKEV